MGDRAGTRYGSVTGKMMIGEDTLGDEEDEGEYLTLPSLRYLGFFPPLTSETKTTTTNEEDDSRIIHAMSKQGMAIHVLYRRVPQAYTPSAMKNWV